MLPQLEYELENENELEGEWEVEASQAQSEWELDTHRAEYTIIPTRDDRVHVTSTTAIPFRYICKLEMVFVDPRTRAARNFIGTGTLVAPSKVLTAAHCIFDRHNGYGYAQRIRVIPGKNGPGINSRTEPLGSALSSRMDVSARWRSAPNHQAAMPYDYGVITLNRPIGQRIGWWRRIAYKPDRLLRSVRVNTSGYPGDKGGNHQYRVYDRVVTVFPQRLEYLHDIMGGQSGSPIWVRWKDFRTIVGIVTTHDDPLTRVVANTGTRITPSVLADIRRWLTR
jgi:glutamyl endopeptidase